jgi:hypothetical protein
MVGGLHIWNKAKKALAIAQRGTGRGLRGRDSKSDLANIKYKPIWNYHNEPPI